MAKISLKNKKIAVVGLGYVGLPLAVEFGKSRKVVGFDVNEARVSELKAGVDLTMEVGLDELRAADLLSFSFEPSEIADCGVFIVTVPTPIDESKRPDLKPLIGACQTVGKLLKTGDVVIFESTVYPGVTEDVCAPILEEQSGLKTVVSDDEPCSTGFYLGYSPERINPGDKNRNLTNIVKVTSGCTPSIAKEIDNLYNEIVIAGTYPAESIKIAEAAKVIENAQRDLNIALMNELSVIFSMMNISIYKVLKAAESKWNFLPFRPGLVGGHCIGVDPYYLTHKASSLGYHAELITAGRSINDAMADRIGVWIIHSLVRSGFNISKSKILILGVTFKANCADTRNSKIFDVIDTLNKWGFKCLIYDPKAPAEVEKKHIGDVEVLQEMNDIKNISAVICAVKHDVFVNLDAEIIHSWFSIKNHPKIIFDLCELYETGCLNHPNFDVRQWLLG